VSLEIYDVINFDVTSCCGYCNRRGKAAAVVKMAASTVTMDAIDYSEVTLIDSNDNKAYSIKVSVQDAERAYKGKTFFISVKICV